MPTLDLLLAAMEAMIDKINADSTAELARRPPDTDKLFWYQGRRFGIGDARALLRITDDAELIAYMRANHNVDLSPKEEE